MPTAAPDFAAAHAQVIALCDHFDARHAEIMAPGYKEDTTRNEFITPFFEALGWDVRNTAHRSVYEKDVVTEKRENIDGTARSADYAFRRPGTHLTAFFVEAKKPKVDIRNHDSCHQAVLYGWNASTPLVVLTDFEQFLILDARSCPDKTDATRHILRQHGSYTYADYRDPEKFAELWGLLARAHVAAGSLDQAAAALPKLSGRIKKGALFARGTRPVDEEFLAQMELWREQLAKSLKRTNHHLDGDRLTALTQRILDRLVFLRFLEDRGIERDVTFADLGKAGSTWQDFLKVSRRLDARYNGIIYKKDDHGCEDKDISIDDTVFAAVVESLRPGQSDYLFAQISVTILGSIYERFLGNVIVARDKTAIVEPKPEVRKAGGVYYTPDYIVRYIVEQTVGRSIAGKKPAEIEKLRFADIACGSGSFLVEVFASLIRYHLAWYLADGAEKWAKKGVLRQRDIDGDYVLTLAEKRRILLACVYGVDLDPSAVEVTQLSLYLRLMEDESFPSTQLLFDEEHRALLPNLWDNIICGNSLVESDVADLFGLTAEEREKIRPLDLRWAFPKVFGRTSAVSSVLQETPGDFVFLGGDSTHGNLDPNLSYKATKTRPAKKESLPILQGGFDAIVGNPPYVRMEHLKPVKAYLASRYRAHEERADTYAYFIERALTSLRSRGLLGYIVSNKFVLAKYGAPLRRVISESANITRIVDLAGLPVFHGATVRTLVLLLERLPPKEIRKPNFYYSPPLPPKEFASVENGSSSFPSVVTTYEQELPQDRFNAGPWTFAQAPVVELIERLERSFPSLQTHLGALPQFGIKTGLNDAFIISAETQRSLVAASSKNTECIRPFLMGRDVRRYSIRNEGRFLIYLYPAKNVRQYPALEKHLLPFRKELEARATKQPWFELQQPAEGLIPLLSQPKIVYPIIAPGPRFALDESGFLINDKLFVLPSADKFLLGLLNSRFGHFYFSQVCARLESAGETYYEFRQQFVKRFPVPRTHDASSREPLVKLVDRMLVAKQAEAQATDGVKRDQCARQCAAFDRQIDALVYELYGLTDAEIALVEAGAGH